MYKSVIIGLLCCLVSVGAIASDGTSNKVSGWVDIPTFCKTQGTSAAEYNKCVNMVSKYKKVTSERFKNLPVDQLRKIGRRITNMANKNSDHHKKLKEAVEGLEDTIRKPIEVPTGVRRSREQYRQQQQQYIK